MSKLIMILSSAFLLFVNCEDDSSVIHEGGSSGGNNDQNGNNKTGWLIPQDEVFDGGPGKDGIPALSNPEFVSAGDADFMRPDELVLGMKEGNVVKAYPHQILDWHEIINDKAGSRKFAVTYCPLTGTGMSWNRVINDLETTFGVSGLLYNTNLIPYDRKTDSYWSQIRLESVHGELIGEDAVTSPLIETTWKTWTEMFPETQVVSLNTGFSRNYGVYPYGNYKSSNSLIFPVKPTDNRLDLKERVHGIILEDDAFVFRFGSFSDDKTSIIHERFKDASVVVIGNKKKNFIVSFMNSDNKTFEPSSNVNGAIFKDASNNYYDVFGEIIQGPSMGERLKATTSFMGFWFSFGAFYPGPKIYGLEK